MQRPCNSTALYGCLSKVQSLLDLVIGCELIIIIVKGQTTGKGDT